MMKTLRSLSFLALLVAPCLQAQQWSIGGGAGAFTFGNFSERRIRLGNENASGSTTVALSAKTRPGFSVDLADDFSKSFGFRLQATFVKAPIAVKSGGGSGVAIDDKLDVTTFSVPLVWNLSRHGAFRFHLLAGPAYAMYRIHRQGPTAGEVFFNGNRNRFGAIGGAGIDWWLSDRFALEGEVSDTVTSSPIERADYQGVTGVQIKKPNNIHTTGGIRYRF